MQAALATAGQAGNQPLLPHQKQLLHALVLQDRQCRQATMSLSQQQSSAEAQEEAWQSQLRFYCCPAPASRQPTLTSQMSSRRGSMNARAAVARAAAAAEAAAAAAAQPDIIVARCGALELSSGCEYWGSSSWAELVVAPELEALQQQLATCLARKQVPVLYGASGGWCEGSVQL